MAGIRFGIMVVDDVTAMAGRALIALYKAVIDGMQIAGEGERDGGAAEFAQKGEERIAGRRFEIVFKNEGRAGAQKLTGSVIKHVLCGSAQSDFFCTGVEADIVKEKLFDGIFGEHGDMQTVGEGGRQRAFA